jgi:hydroxyethylthiazole kinase
MPAEESEMPHAQPAVAPDIADWPRVAGALLERLRAEPVRVHAITNSAAQTLTANLLLAAGGVPSLTVAPEEAPAFASRAAALLVNLGTLDHDRRAAIPWAIAAARGGTKPWVLDPVFVDASPPRLDLARLCLAGHPCIVRCNPSEFAALAGAEASPDAAAAFARAHDTVVALTGPTDWVTDGDAFLAIENGHPLMAQVTAMGCAATALIAAFAASSGATPLEAAASALLVTGIAGEIAGAAAGGPGTFQPLFLDAIASLDADTIRIRARIA